MWRPRFWLGLWLATSTACVPLPAVTLGARATFRTSPARSERRIEARVACAWSLDPRVARADHGAEPASFDGSTTLVSSDPAAPCAAPACAWEQAARAQALSELGALDARSSQGGP